MFNIVTSCKGVIGMSEIEELKKRGELVVDVPLEDLRKAATMTLGMMTESQEGNITVFTARSVVCPSQVKAKLVDKDTYHIFTTSLCTVEDCTYALQCIRLDNERLEAFRRNLEKVIGRPLRVEVRYEWRPERIREDEKLKTILERVLERKKGEEI